MPLDLRSLVDAVSHGVSSLGQAPEGAAAKLWEETRGWIGRFFTNATDKWIATYSRQEPCAVKVLRNGVPFPCPGFSVLTCDACEKPTCIHHARVDQHGDGTCYHCIADVISIKRSARVTGHKAPPGQDPGAPPPDVRDEIVRRALAVLGLKPGASWEEVRAAHRKRAAAAHPDRARTEAERAKSEEKCKKLNAALAELSRHYKAAA